MPPTDDLDRDRFYTRDADVDGDEYELEGPDPAVLAAEKRRAEEVVASTKRSIDIDEIYREADRSPSSELLENWFRNFDFRFRFQVKHLLIATAVLSILLTLWQLEWLGTALVLLVMGGVIGSYLYLQWKDKQHQDAAAERRRRLYAERRDAQENAGAAIDTAIAPATTAAAPLPANEVDEAWQKAMHEQRFRFQFSLKQLLAVMVCAAVVMGMVRILGGPQETASILGMIALVGLVVHAAGFDPPAVVALGWWLLLLMYVVLSIVGVMWNAMQ